MFMTFHLNAEEYIFFASAHGTIFMIDHVLGHKSNLSKFKKIEIVKEKKEIVSSTLSNHDAMRLDINYKKTW